MTTRSKIFLVEQSSWKARVIEEAPYPTEDVLQQAIEQHPELIPGEQLDPENPRRWLLVQREMGIPAEAGASDQWSLDHLLVDQDAIPTFVECKRSSNPEIRRQVVAQMLDYAANATAYWPAGRLREAAAATASANGSTLEYVTSELVGAEADDLEEADGFWAKVDANLHEGRVRLVFVADRIPPELQRLVDYLGRQMTTTDVAAVEVKFFDGEGLRALVPRVTGRSPRPDPPRGPTTVNRFLDRIERPDYRESLARLFDRISASGATVNPGSVGFSFRAGVLEGHVSIAWLLPPGKFYRGSPDLTLGFDEKRALAFPPEVQNILRAYAEKASGLPGATPVRAGSLLGGHLAPEAVIASEDAIVDAIQDVAARLAGVDANQDVS